MCSALNAYDSSDGTSESDGPDPTVTLDYGKWPRLALGDSERSRSGRAADREGGSGPARVVTDPAAGTMPRARGALGVVPARRVEFAREEFRTRSRARWRAYGSRCECRWDCTDAGCR